MTPSSTIHSSIRNEAIRQSKPLFLWVKLHEIFFDLLGVGHGGEEDLRFETEASSTGDTHYPRFKWEFQRTIVAFRSAKVSATFAERKATLL